MRLALGRVVAGLATGMQNCVGELVRNVEPLPASTSLGLIAHDDRASKSERHGINLSRDGLKARHHSSDEFGKTGHVGNWDRSQRPTPDDIARPLVPRPHW